MAVNGVGLSSACAAGAAWSDELPDGGIVRGKRSHGECQDDIVGALQRMVFLLELTEKAALLCESEKIVLRKTTSGRVVRRKLPGVQDDDVARYCGKRRAEESVSPENPQERNSLQASIPPLKKQKPDSDPQSLAVADAVCAFESIPLPERRFSVYEEKTYKAAQLNARVCCPSSSFFEALLAGIRDDMSALDASFRVTVDALRIYTQRLVNVEKRLPTNEAGACLQEESRIFIETFKERLRENEVERLSEATVCLGKTSDETAMLNVSELIESTARAIREDLRRNISVTKEIMQRLSDIE